MLKVWFELNKFIFVKNTWSVNILIKFFETELAHIYSVSYNLLGRYLCF